MAKIIGYIMFTCLRNNMISVTYCVHFSEEEVLSDWKLSGLSGAGTLFGG